MSDKPYYLVPAHVMPQMGKGHPILPQFSTNPPVFRLQEAIDQLNENKHLNPDQRWKSYENIFQNYFRQKHTFDGPPRQTSDTRSMLSDEMMSHILNTLPKGKLIQKRGRQLLLFVTQTPTFQWSEKGELNSIPGSKITDLIDYAIRYHAKGSPEPIGWKIFSNLLTDAGVPPDLLKVSRVRKVKTPKPSPKRKRLRPKSSSEDDIYWDPYD